MARPVLVSERIDRERSKENNMKNRSQSASFKKWFLSSILIGGLVGLLVSGCASPSGGSSSGLKLNLNDAYIVVGGPSQQLTASRPVTWTSSDPAVASVSSSGLVTALTMGTATVTATSGSSTATCTVQSNVLLMWGSVQTAGGPIPVYWKDNVLHTLPVGQGSLIYGEVNATIIDGTDIYMGGHLTDAAGSSVPVYWKNGTLIPLTVPSGYSYSPDWTQPNIDAAGNLYIRGNLRQLWNNQMVQVPGMWINGVWTPISMTLPSGQEAVSGFISSEYFDNARGIVYFSGGLSDIQAGTLVPVYWSGINGAATPVSLASVPSTYGGFVSATLGPPNQPLMSLLAIYDATGSPHPAYSINGVVTPVSTGPYASGVMWWAYTDAFGITYATGDAGTNFWGNPNGAQSPVYWRNWQIQTLPLPSGFTKGVENGSYEDSTGAMYFVGQAFNDTTSLPLYWIDGVVHLLPLGEYSGGTANARLIGINF